MTGEALFDVAVAYAKNKYPKVDAETLKRISQAFIDGGIRATNSQWKAVKDLAEENKINPALRKYLIIISPGILLNETTMESVFYSKPDLDKISDGDDVPYSHYIHLEPPV